MKVFRASGNAGAVTKPTAKEAAISYFEKFPTSRKCNVLEGEDDGAFFRVSYGNKFSTGGWPKSYKDVTKKQAATLGDENANNCDI